MTGPSGLINTDKGQTVNKGKSSWRNVTNVQVETDLTAKKQQVQYILLEWHLSGSSLVLSHCLLTPPTLLSWRVTLKGRKSY